MKYMLIMRSTAEAIEASKEIDFDEIIAAMGRYNESLVEAGVLIGGDGLSHASEGFVVDFDETPPLITDGPYGEIKELFNGLWIVEAPDLAAATALAADAPLADGMHLEVRRVHGEADLPA